MRLNPSKKNEQRCEEPGKTRSRQVPGDREQQSTEQDAPICNGSSHGRSGLHAECDQEVSQRADGIVKARVRSLAIDDPPSRVQKGQSVPRASANRRSA